MRRKLSLVTAGLLAGATISMGTAAPASAQPVHGCTSTDPVLAYVCRTIDNVGPWAYYYYYKAGETVKDAYCLVWPDLCA